MNGEKRRPIETPDDWALTVEWAIAAQNVNNAQRRLDELSAKLGVPREATLDVTARAFRWEERK